MDSSTPAAQCYAATATWLAVSGAMTESGGNQGAGPGGELERGRHGGEKDRRKYREDEELVTLAMVLRASVDKLSEIQRHACFTQVNTVEPNHPTGRLSRNFRFWFCPKLLGPRRPKRSRSSQSRNICQLMYNRSSS
ncbi:hypothetical protein K0M31_003863 [Melipona bicolor]|uniref:Uncharacterized protein n=1 Tax=Melipona bicolor TaxID=60889 RepID=A0AA40KNV8_9HYME|nr:hypothetical protein K0M31_003863 [Melipona bicolor]